MKLNIKNSAPDTGVAHDALEDGMTCLAADEDGLRLSMEFDVHALMTGVISKARMSAPGPDSLRFEHLLFLVAPAVGEFKLPEMTFSGGVSV